MFTINEDKFRKELKDYIKDHNVDIDLEKFRLTFSLAKTPDKIWEVFEKNNDLFQNKDRKIPLAELEGIYKSFYWFTKLYIYLIYMRSKTLEEGLPEVKNHKNLKIFSDNLSSDFIRHLRNAAAHGTISMTSEGIEFTDKNFRTDIKFNELQILFKFMIEFFFIVYESQCLKSP